MTSPVDLDAQREIDGLKAELVKSRAEAYRALALEDPEFEPIALD